MVELDLPHIEDFSVVEVLPGSHFNELDVSKDILQQSDSPVLRDLEPDFVLEDLLEGRYGAACHHEEHNE